MEVRYLGEISPSGCKKGKIYVVISVEGEDNFEAYRILDETGEDYLYPVNSFEVVGGSGPMSGLEADTIGGFNSLIKKQKMEPGEAIVSTVLFDDTCEVIHDRVPMDKVQTMNEDTYFVRGCTALLDAVGGAIHHVRSSDKLLTPSWKQKIDEDMKRRSRRN